MRGVAVAQPGSVGADRAVQDALALEADRHRPDDLEHAMRELVEVAVRVLSPAINSPLAAIGMLDRLGAALCSLAGRTLPTGVTQRAGHTVLVIPGFEYDGLLNAMFHMIGQHGNKNPAVPIRLLEVLTAVVRVEANAARIDSLVRHADLVFADAEQERFMPSDIEDLRRRHQRFGDVQRQGIAVLAGEAMC